MQALSARHRAAVSGTASVHHAEGRRPLRELAGALKASGLEVREAGDCGEQPFDSGHLQDGCVRLARTPSSVNQSDSDEILGPHSRGRRLGLRATQDLVRTSSSVKPIPYGVGVGTPGWSAAPGGGVGTLQSLVDSKSTGSPKGTQSTRLGFVLLIDAFTMTSA
jgi:hypothetical protein